MRTAGTRRTGCTSGGSSGTAGTRRRGRAVDNRDRQRIACHRAIIVGDDRMDFIGRSVGVSHLHCHRRMTGSFFDLDAIRVPANRIRTAVFAVDGSTKVNRCSLSCSLSGDLQRQRRKDSGHIHILRKIRIFTGLTCYAIAPLNKNMVLLGNCGHCQRLGRIRHSIFQAAFSGILADAQSAAAIFIDPIADLILFLFLFCTFARACTLALTFTACAGRRRFTAAYRFRRAAGSLHCRTGI